MSQPKPYLSPRYYVIIVDPLMVSTPWFEYRVIAIVVLRLGPIDCPSAYT